MDGWQIGHLFRILLCALLLSVFSRPKDIGQKPDSATPSACCYPGQFTQHNCDPSPQKIFAVHFLKQFNIRPKMRNGKPVRQSNFTTGSRKISHLGKLYIYIYNSLTWNKVMLWSNITLRPYIHIIPGSLVEQDPPTRTIVNDWPLKMDWNGDVPVEQCSKIPVSFHYIPLYSIILIGL